MTHTELCTKDQNEERLIRVYQSIEDCNVEELQPVYRGVHVPFADKFAALTIVEKLISL